MKNKLPEKKPTNVLKRTFLSCFILLTGILLLDAAKAKISPYKVCRSRPQVTTDTMAEKKVDYLEQIYFSGKNKENLNRAIAAVILDMEAKPATEAVTKQYLFLGGIKDQATAAEDACEIEDILAVGIYDIDPAEAALQNIPQPGKKFSEKFDKTLAGVNGLSNSTANAALSVFVLSKGSAGTLGLANNAAFVGNTVGTIAAGKKAYDDTKKLIRWVSGDKPCKKVHPKNIEIGPHIVPDANAAVDK